MATLTLRPTGNGALTDWTGDYTAVDEASVSDTDYINTSGTNYETFTFADCGLGAATINSVTVYFRCRYTPVPASVYPVIRYGGSNYVGNTVTSTGSFVTYNQVYTTNPGTSAAWTAASIDASEFGVVAANQRCSWFYIVIDYTAAPSASWGGTWGG